MMLLILPENCKNYNNNLAKVVLLQHSLLLPTMAALRTHIHKYYDPIKTHNEGNLLLSNSFKCLLNQPTYLHTLFSLTMGLLLPQFAETCSSVRIVRLFEYSFWNFSTIYAGFFPPKLRQITQNSDNQNRKPVPNHSFHVN